MHTHTNTRTHVQTLVCPLLQCVDQKKKRERSRQTACTHTLTHTFKHMHTVLTWKHTLDQWGAEVWLIRIQLLPLLAEKICLPASTSVTRSVDMMCVCPCVCVCVCVRVRACVCVPEPNWQAKGQKDGEKDIQHVVEWPTDGDSQSDRSEWQHILTGGGAGWLTDRHRSPYTSLDMCVFVCACVCGRRLRGSQPDGVFSCVSIRLSAERQQDKERVKGGESEGAAVGWKRTGRVTCAYEMGVGIDGVKRGRLSKHSGTWG